MILFRKAITPAQILAQLLLQTLSLLKEVVPSHTKRFLSRLSPKKKRS